MKVEIDSIVKSVCDDLKITAQKQDVAVDVSSLEEAYVASPKQFRLTSEFSSQKTKDAHLKLYKNYTETLTRVSAELDSADRSDVNSRHGTYRSLKLDEAFNINATWLHELYFANSGDQNSQIYMDSLAFLKLQESFGTFENWQNDFMACCAACGNGWAVCGYSTYLHKIVNTMVSNNSQDVMLGLYPLVVVDMHEHSYFRDFLTDKDNYVVTTMRELNWVVIEDRFNIALKLGQALK
jgi:Fe-Mn family superoxide dismutase